MTAGRAGAGEDVLAAGGRVGADRRPLGADDQPRRGGACGRHARRGPALASGKHHRSAQAESTAGRPQRGPERGSSRLKEFLTYARNAGGPAAHEVEARPGDTDGVVADVCRALVEKGWAADARLGAAGGVDIAVRSRSLTDRYVLGILLDGPAASWLET